MTEENPQSILDDNNMFKWDKFPLEYPTLSILVVTENSDVLPPILQLYPGGVLNTNTQQIQYPDDMKLNTISKLDEIKEGKTLLVDLNTFIHSGKVPLIKPLLSILDDLKLYKNRKHCISHILAFGSISNINQTLYDNFDIILFVAPRDAENYLKTRRQQLIQGMNMGKPFGIIIDNTLCGDDTMKLYQL